MDALVLPIKGLVTNPVTEEEKLHNAKLIKHGVKSLFRRNGKRLKSVRDMAQEQLLEEQELEANDES